MIFKLAVILLVSSAIAFCSVTCDPRKPQASDHCQKPVKNSEKPSIGCCQSINGVIEKNADFDAASLVWSVAIALPHHRTNFLRVISLQNFAASPAQTHAILRT